MRQGKPGTSYANRSDLQSAEPVAIKTAPGQTYGQRTAQAAAQKAVPLAPPPGPAVTPSAPPVPAGPPHSGQQLGPQTPQQSPPQSLHSTSPEPGELHWTGPSQRPNEPLTHGMAQGPGAGPTVLTGIGAIANRTNPQDTATKLLATLAMQPTAGSQLRDLARVAMATSG